MTFHYGKRLIVLMTILLLGCRSGNDELTEKWTVIDTGIGSFFLNHEDVFFTGSETGWVTGTGYVLHTSNGGKTWYYQVNDTAGIYKGFFRSLFFTDEDHGWVCGDLGTFLRTTNGGTSWQQVSVPEYNLSSVFFIRLVFVLRVSHRGSGILNDGRWRFVGIAKSGFAESCEG